MFASLLASLCLAADPYADLSKSKPAMPAALSALTPGLKGPALDKVMKLSDRDDCFSLGVRVGGLCVLPWTDSAGGFSRLSLLFKSLTATSTALRKRWGAPMVHNGFSYWVNPEASPLMRAELRKTDDPAQVDLEVYLPLHDFLGAGRKLGFERTPIIGSSQVDLEKGYRTDCEGGTCFLHFPPCEVDSALLVHAEMVGGTAKSIWFDLPASDPARVELTMRLLEKKWGKRKQVEGEPYQFTFEDQPGVHVDTHFSVSVRIRP